MAQIQGLVPPFKRSGTTITERTSGDNVNHTGNINIATGKVLSYNSNPWIERADTNNQFIGVETSPTGLSGASYNLCVGISAGLGITSGDANVLVGGDAGLVMATGSANVIAGYGSLKTGIANNSVIIGNYAAKLKTGITSSVIIGKDAAGLDNTTSLSNSVVIGASAGEHLTSGSSNVLIGYNAGGNLTSGNSNVLIGYNAGSNLTTQSNLLYIENSNSATPLIYGEFDNNILGLNANVGINTHTPLSSLHLFSEEATDNSDGWYYGDVTKGLILGTSLEDGIGVYMTGESTYRMSVIDSSTMSFGDTSTGAIGSEIIDDNADFSQATWTLAGDFAPDGVKAKFTYATGGGTITQALADFAVSPSKFLYKVVVTVEASPDIDSGALITAELNGYTQSIKLTTGTNSYVLWADAEQGSVGDFVLTISGASSGSITITNISVKEVEAGGIYVTGESHFYEAFYLHSNSITHTTNGVNDFSIINTDLDKDIIFSGNDGGSQTTIMKLDVSEGQLTGIIKATTGVLGTATAETDYVTPTGAGTLTNKNIQRTINAQTGTEYTFVLGDAGKVVTLANADTVVVTVPTNAGVAYAVGTQIDCVQEGAGKVNIVPAGGVTLNSKNYRKAINGQYVGATLLKTATDTWTLLGDLTTTTAVYGYFSGGFTGAIVATTDRIVFSTGVTSANTASNLSVARYVLGSLSDGSTYGYFAGGYSTDNTATVDRIVFSTGVTSANTVSNLSQARESTSGVSDGSTYGYFAGGLAGVTYYTLTDRIVFSTGVTSANTVSNLSVARYGLSAVSDNSLYGYFAGGSTGAIVVTADRIVFSTGVTSANTVSNLSEARRYPGSLSDGSTYGYFAGGYSTDNTATVDRIVFSTGVTSANTVSNLSVATRGIMGVSDGSLYGYFAGGSTGVAVANAYRIVFSTGVTSANTVSNLSVAKQSGGSLSDYVV